MKFIKPRRINAQSTDWKISEQSRAIVKYYAEYTEYSESEVVDLFLKRLLEDKDFIEWVNSKRFNKRILALLAQELDEQVNASEENRIG